MAIKTSTYSQTGVGITEHVDVFDTNDIKVAWQVSVEGSVTYTLEHSLNAINFIANTDALNFTTDSDGNYILPVRAIRLNVTGGTGTATLVVRQLVV